MGKVVAFTGGALIALCTTSAAAWAAPAPLGAPFRISPCTNCRQENPAVAGMTSGASMTVWEGSSVRDAFGINGRFFNAAGAALGADVLVAQPLPPDQDDAAVARDTKGNFIVVWSSVSGGNIEIMARKYQANGKAVGNPFKVNADATGTPTVPSDLNPVVAPMNDGGFVVAWINLLPPSPTFQGTTPQVLARRFNAAGAPVGAQVKVNTGLVSGDRPDICVDTTGRPIVAWTTVDEFRPFEPSKKGASLRILTAQGALTGTTETVASAPTAKTSRAAISCGAGSTFVVVWHTDDALWVERTDIVGQRFTRLGRPAGAKFRVNSITTGDQKNPAISHDSTGAFVVAWQSDLGNVNAIHGRRFAANGVATGTDFVVFSEQESSLAPAAPDVAHLNANNFVVVWQDGARALFGRRFKP